ncbi:MAG: class I SAM-dependent methyltransferase [Flavobacteriia bacterium]|jgi:2-polyprenyl-3-methyl-5-hydroxy-6-metoxy-1,4-benzoquinol methylase
MEKEINIAYNRIEDLKRLNFIESAIKKLDKKDLSILDVGCGNGNISRYLGSKDFSVLGIDISEASILKARMLNFFENVSFRHLAAEELIGVQKFDVVVCSEVIEHLDNPQLVLNQLRKLLNPGGLLIVTVPNGYGPRELFITKPLQFMKSKLPSVYSVVNKLKKSMGFSGETVQSDAENLTHVQFFTKNSLVNLISKNELQLIGFRGSNFVEGVFPISLISKKSTSIQKFDCWLADQLPVSFASGFMTVWTNKD